MNIAEIDFDDPNIWKLISSGNTKFCFQIDSPLGQVWCKRIQPSSISELSDIISLIRPGCLNSYIGDPPRNMAQIYTDRKHGLEKIEYLHPILEPILKFTQGVLVYQEQSIRIAKDIAGFSGMEADLLRKSIGRKDTKLMSELEKTFIQGCEKTGIVTKKIAQQLFNNIKASNRYAFNKCLSPTTLVETKDGFKTIEEADIGTQIRCPSGWFSIINKYYNGKKDCVEITTELGKKIICTLDHKFLCDDGKIRSLLYILANKPKILNNKLKGEDICSVDYFDNIDTMDIEVDSPNHIFYGNGIATSNSHSVSYAILSAQTAYLKHYFSLEFFTACLIESRSKQKPREEVRDLVNDGRTNNIEFLIPDLRDKKLEGYIKKDTIKFGLSNIKGIGDSAQSIIIDLINETELEIGKPIKDFIWTDFLFLISDRINSQVVEGLIYCGALDFLKIPRSQMFFEYEKYQLLTKGEKSWIVQNQKRFPFLSLYDALLAVSPKKKNGGGCHTDKKTEFVLGLAKSIDQPSLKIKDSPKFIAMMEEKYLGVSITCSKTDGSMESDIANYTCADLNNGAGSINISFVAEINRYKEHQTKKGDSAGRWMAFVDVFDKTANLKEGLVIFPDAWEDNRDSFDETASYFFVGHRSKKGSIIIENFSKIL